MKFKNLDSICGKELTVKTENQLMVFSCVSCKETKISDEHVLIEVTK